MKPTYLEAWKIKGMRGAPKQRADFVHANVTKRNGVWIQVHDSIDKAFDKTFAETEDDMVARFGEVFDTLHGNFQLLCKKSEAKSPEEKVLEGKLRDDLKESSVRVKSMLAEDGEIASLVAACQAYQSPSANSQSLFLPA
jgi:hypothetical protein